MIFAGFENRLEANNAFAFDFSFIECSIMNIPVPAKKLDGMLAVILDGDAVGKDKMTLVGYGIPGLIFSNDRNTYSLCDLGYHSKFGIQGSSGHKSKIFVLNLVRINKKIFHGC